VSGILKWLSLTFLFPLGVALWFGESPWPFVIPVLATGGAAFLGERLCHPPDKFWLREAALVVSLSWLSFALVGSIPFILAGNLSFVDAAFESMSGFTTTGSTILTDIAGQPQGLLFWRQFIQWLGGMGIIVLAVAILPKLSVGGRQLLESEAPGPEVEKLTPRIHQTARTLWLLYFALTLLEAVLLWLAGMTPLHAIEHAFTTLSTGGFSPFNRGIVEVSPLAQWIIVPFMLLGATSFALMYRGFTRGPSAFLKDQEFRVYVFIYAAAVLAVLATLSPDLSNLEQSLRQSAFQVASILTTTGYANTDFNLWEPASKIVLLLLMLIGGMAGSTTGSVKVVRFMLTFKMVLRELFKAVHPEAVTRIRLGTRVVSEAAVNGMVAFTVFYFTFFIAGSVLLLLDAQRVGLPLTFLEAASAAAATLGNVGPGLGIAGPMNSFADFPATSKFIMFLLMWAGRLELFPVLVLFTRHYWKR